MPIRKAARSRCSAGKRLRYERLQTSAELLKSFIKEVPRPRHLCMEEGTLSEWLYEELAPVVDKLVVVMPDRNPGNKSDLIDASKLADDLRRDAIARPVYKAPGCFRALREAARAHYVLQRDKVRTKSRLNALCRGCGRAELAKSLYASKTRAEALQQLPEHLRPRAALFAQELDAVRSKTQQTRGLNHNRHPLLKNVFKGAARQITLMPEHQLGRAYQRLLTTTKPNLARLTIARRLAAAVLAMWKNGKDYEPTRHDPPATPM